MCAMLVKVKKKYFIENVNVRIKCRKSMKESASLSRT